MKTPKSISNQVCRKNRKTISDIDKLIVSLGTDIQLATISFFVKNSKLSIDDMKQNILIILKKKSKYKKLDENNIDIQKLLDTILTNKW